MYVVSVNDVLEEPVRVEGAERAWIRWLIDESRGAERLAMRVVRVEPGGRIPEHKHWYEHEIFVLRGEGVIRVGGEEKRVSEGDFVYVPPWEPHSYRNEGGEDWVYLCVIPLEKCR